MSQTVFSHSGKHYTSDELMRLLTKYLLTQNVANMQILYVKYLVGSITVWYQFPELPPLFRYWATLEKMLGFQRISRFLITRWWQAKCT